MHFRGETPRTDGVTGPAAPSHAHQSRFHVASTEPKIDDGIREKAFFQPSPKNWMGDVYQIPTTGAWERSDDPCGEVGIGHSLLLLLGFHIYHYLLSFAGCWWARPTPSPGSPTWRGRARCTSAPPRRPAAVNSYPSIPKVRKKRWKILLGWGLRGGKVQDESNKCNQLGKVIKSKDHRDDIF